MDGGFRSLCHLPVKGDGEPYRINEEGYVILARVADGKRVYRSAHKIRHEATTGRVSDVLDHLCRNRWCCNPEHLEAVTPAINLRRGDCAKISDIEAATIRKLHAEGVTQAALGKEFGLSQSHVSRIANELYWNAGPCRHWEQRKVGTQNL